MDASFFLQAKTVEHKMFTSIFGKDSQKWRRKIKNRFPHEKEYKVDLNDTSGFILGDSWLERKKDFISHSPLTFENFPSWESSGLPAPTIGIQVKKRFLLIARDYLGFHPLYYAKTHSGIIFADKKSLLSQLGFKPETFSSAQKAEITSSGRIYNVQNTYRPPLLEKQDVFSKNKIEQGIYENLITTIREVIQKRNAEKVAIAFSGGIDSSLLTLATKEAVNTKFFLLTVGKRSSHDRQAARKSFQTFKDNVNAEHIEIDLQKKQCETSLCPILKRIESPSPLQLELALPLHFIRKKAINMGIDLIFAGQGADELFWGYHKYLRASNTQERLKIEQRMLKNMARRNLTRDFKIFDPLPVSFPYLSKKILSLAAKIPPDQKMDRERRKKPLVNILQDLGFPSLAKKRKKALQYGSDAKDILVEIAEEKGLEGLTHLTKKKLEECWKQDLPSYFHL